MEKINDLRKLLKHELDDLYSAETQLIDALPEMVKSATDNELKAAISGHLKVTKTQKERLVKIRRLLNDGDEEPKEARGFFASLFMSKEGEEHCKAMEGLIKEADTLMKEDMTSEVKDAAIIAAAQKIEHYEISSYGTAKAYAMQLGLKQVAQLLNTTLDEEYAADDSLTLLAVGRINLEAGDDKSDLADLHSTADTAPVVKKTPAKKRATPKSKTGTRTKAKVATAKSKTNSR
jgi:ferritin-like metal-binding protein YciE